MVDVLRYRWISFAVSCTILATAAYMYVQRSQVREYAFNYSVDFTGGTQVLLQCQADTTQQQIEQAIDQDWPQASVRSFDNGQFMIRVKEFSNDPQGLAGRILQAVQQQVPGTQVSILENEAVGPGIGHEVRTNAYIAILLALIAMLCYIAVRFWSLGFAVGSVVALFHDALIMLAFFLIFDQEISITVIGAMLAVLGYSINDTIVIFSQIRDTLKSSHGSSIYDIVNKSLNHTMRRTLLTSFSTGLTVGSMFLFGGQTLRGFSFALFVGIIFGTLSSIFIASPIVMLFYKNQKKTV